MYYNLFMRKDYTAACEPKLTNTDSCPCCMGKSIRRELLDTLFSFDGKDNRFVFLDLVSGDIVLLTYCHHCMGKSGQ